MKRRFFFAAGFGTLVGLVASAVGSAGRSPLQVVLIGLLSSMGFFIASFMARSRSISKQGVAPVMLPGEVPKLYGPGEVIDAQGRAKAWIYLSDKRLLLKDEDGLGAEVALADIGELRPLKHSWFNGEVTVVARGHGVITLRVPDSRRWHKAIQEALRASL